MTVKELIEELENSPGSQASTETLICIGAGEDFHLISHVDIRFDGDGPVAVIFTKELPDA